MAKEIKKYTKKASAYIMKFLLKDHPTASKLTSFDQAFVILMTDWDMDIDVYTDTSHHTRVSLYRGDDLIKTFEWDNIDTEEPVDLDWNIIYKEILETIIKKKLYKKPKLGKRAQKKLEEQKINKVPKPVEEQAVQEATVIVTPVELTLEELKKRKSSLYQRIRTWKKKDKDITELVKEYNEISNKLKS